MLACRCPIIMRQAATTKLCSKLPTERSPAEAQVATRDEHTLAPALPADCTARGRAKVWPALQRNSGSTCCGHRCKMVPCTTSSTHTAPPHQPARTAPRQMLTQLTNAQLRVVRLLSNCRRRGCSSGHADSSLRPSLRLGKGAAAAGSGRLLGRQHGKQHRREVCCHCVLAQSGWLSRCCPRCRLHMRRRRRRRCLRRMGQGRHQGRCILAAPVCHMGRTGCRCGWTACMLGACTACCWLLRLGLWLLLLLPLQQTSRCGICWAAPAQLLPLRRGLGSNCRLVCCGHTGGFSW